MIDNPCKWAVSFDIPGANYDDQKPRTQIVALFRYHCAAEDFIEKCLPVETRDKFYIVNTEEIKDVES